MSSLRIAFPETDSSITFALKGDRLTIGRRPTNTIQVLDRTLSSSHAELIAEADGHYRLHDLGSTNGTRVNGEAITDFHLQEPCKISFGSVECEFNMEAAPEGSAIESLPTRAEMEALKQVNAELHAKVELWREQAESLKKAQAAEGEENAAALMSAELQRVIVERGQMKESEQRKDAEIQRLQVELALVKRDRANLENALRQAAGSTKVGQGSPSETRDSRPQPVAAPKAGTTPVAPVESQVAVAPTSPPTPTPSTPVRPPAPTPSPLKPYPPVSKPTLPPPSAPSLSPASSPSTNGSGTTRPVPKFVPKANPAVPAEPARH